jgi:hypothetical protein
LTLHHPQKKSGGRNIDRRFETFESLRERGFYDDLYLTEQPYGLVSGVATDLPAND